MRSQEYNKLLYKGESRFTKPPVCKIGKPCVQRSGQIVCIPKSSKCNTNSSVLPELPIGTGLMQAAKVGGAVALAGAGGMALLGALSRRSQPDINENEPVLERYRNRQASSPSTGLGRSISEQLSKGINNTTQNYVAPVLGSALLAGAVGAGYGLSGGLRDRINQYINSVPTSYQKQADRQTQQSIENPTRQPTQPTTSPTVQQPAQPTNQVQADQQTQQSIQNPTRQPTQPTTSPTVQQPAQPTSYQAQADQQTRQSIQNLTRQPAQPTTSPTVQQPAQLTNQLPSQQESQEDAKQQGIREPSAFGENIASKVDIDAVSDTPDIEDEANEPEKYITPQISGTQTKGLLSPSLTRSSRGNRSTLQREWTAIPDPIQYESFVRSKARNNPEFKAKSAEEKKQAYLEEIQKIADKAQEDLSAYAEKAGAETAYYQNRIKKLQELVSELERYKRKPPAGANFTSLLQRTKNLISAMRRRNDSIADYIIVVDDIPYNLGYQKAYGVINSLFRFQPILRGAVRAKAKKRRMVDVIISNKC